MADYRVALEFNPLDYPQSLTVPKRFGTAASQEHLPFIKLLVHLMRPKVFVELGVHKGDSYLAICEAINALGIKISCYGVGTWNGAETALSTLRQQHDPVFGHFSNLIEGTVDTAAAHFSEGSIELLHIDGQHVYEAVCHDWETFRPKMSRNGVVLFHFTNRREGNYGVWKLWEQLRATYRHFEFLHGNGLGVLVLSPGISEALNAFLTMAEKNPALIRSYFFALGNRIALHAKAGSDLAATQALETRLKEFDVIRKQDAEGHEQRLLQHREELEKLRALYDSRAQEIEALKRTHADEVAKLDRLCQARTEQLDSHKALSAAELERASKQHTDEFANAKRVHTDELANLNRVHAGEVQRLEAACKSSATEIERITQVLRTQTAERDELQRLCRAHEIEIDSLKLQNQDQSAHVEKLNALAQTRADEAEKLNQLCHSRAVEIEALNRSSHAHVDEIDELNRLCQTHSDETEKLNALCAARAKEIETLNLAARTRADELDKLSRQSKTQEQEVTRLNALLKTRAEDIEKLERTARMRKHEFDEQEQLMRMQTEETENQARAHVDTVATLERAQADALAALDRKRSDEIAKLERSIADESAKMARLTESHGDVVLKLNAKIDEREESLRTRDSEVTAQKEKIEKLQAEVESLREAKARLEGDPSHKLGRTLYAPFRFLKGSPSTPRPVATSVPKQIQSGPKT